MTLYLLRRCAGLLAVLLAMSFIVFCLQSIIPADPAKAMAGPAAPAATLELIRQRLGLDAPMLVQYGRFLTRVLHGDLGVSVHTRQPVAADILKYLPASLELGIAAMIVALPLAAAIGLAQNMWRGADAVRLMIIGAGSVPIFLSAILLVYVVWFKLGWLPGAGRLGIRGFSGPTGLDVLDGLIAGRLDVVLDALAHLALPAIALSLPVAVAVGRSLGASLHDVLRQPYIGTARGKGLRETRVVLRHGFRNAASAPLAMAGLQVGLLFGNLLIVERVFAWPGLGLYMVQAFATSDLPAVLGVSLAFGVIYVVANIAVEIAQSLADPRIEL